MFEPNGEYGLEPPNTGRIENRWEYPSEQSGVLEQAAGQAFYNTSPFQLKDLTSRATQQQLRDDFNAYLDGFSPNVQDIPEKFEFRNQINRRRGWRD